MEHFGQMKEVLKLEADSILRVIDLLDEKMCNKLTGVFEYLHAHNGQMVLCGVGKSGLIGEKLSSTFSSLGLRSIFLHPTEALHGDLGRVSENDAIIFLSKSGTTSEILKLIPFLRIRKENRIALVGDLTKQIALECGISFDCSVEREACINDLAPTTSSTVALAMGDAIAVAYEKFVGLSREGFAINHPGGKLGKSLTMKVKDLMWVAKECPILKPSNLLKDAVLEMTNKPLGALAVIENNSFSGILVEGDIRRSIAKNANALETALSEIMTKEPKKVSSDDLAIDALTSMEQNKIYVLPVIDGNEFKGFIRMHDLLKEGF
ncbi:KpsF/GutQ family sugar-phosphate isomerase [Halobacteriovorax sp. XZX-3]|uniref:KpsF/GutQ family sugar-phosphate isomerase n=1 Tax=unclassified Halobacteriovorax TaxID=2639665 RepID=UPI003716CF97